MRILRALLVAALALLPPAVHAQQTKEEIARQLDTLRLEYAHELERVNTYLAYFDQVGRMEVAGGAKSSTDADAGTRGMAEQLFRSSFADADFAMLQHDHKAAAQQYFDQIAREIDSAQQWAEGTSPAAAKSALVAARQLYDALAGQHVDPLDALETAARAHAQSRGSAELTPSLNPFAGQADRIAASIPDARAQRSLTAAARPIPKDGKQPPPTDIARPPQNTPIPPAYGTPVPPAEMTPPPAPDPRFLMDFNTANSLYQAGNYAEAMPKYDDLVQRDGTFRQARFERAIMRIWTNNLVGALDDLRNLAAERSDIESRRLRVLLEVSAGDVKVARAEGEKLLADAPGNLQVQLAAGQAILFSGDQQRGQALLQQVAAADPSVISGMYNQAQSFLQGGVVNIAAVQFATVVWADPNQTNAYYGMGMAYSAAGNSAQAIEALERYLQSDSTSQWAQQARSEVARLRAGR